MFDVTKPTEVHFTFSGFSCLLGDTFLICWITLHQPIFFRSAIAKQKKEKSMVKCNVVCRNFPILGDIYNWLLLINMQILLCAILYLVQEFDKVE